MLIATRMDQPSEAKILSHALLIKSGYVKSLVSGVYSYLPLGNKVLLKIQQVIRDILNKYGLQEILTSVIQPKEIWLESGRWNKYGKELFRLKDRHDRDFCLGPTHEEVFTSIVRDLVKSPKQLPLNIYQIQVKYRDELRPRFGLIRSREFIMCDAYSFDKDKEGLDVSYNTMYEAYKEIFDTLGIEYKIVLADTGSIGGNVSHQFMALSEYGESDILYCECGYACDGEKAWSKPSKVEGLKSSKKLVLTKDIKSIDEVANFFNTKKENIVKSYLLRILSLNKNVLVLVRADKDVNFIKVANHYQVIEDDIVKASETDIKNLNTYEGFIGPVGLNCDILVDEEVSLMDYIICGANKLDYHLQGVKFKKDFDGFVGDFRNVIKGDLCPMCGKKLDICRGIEVGQIFKLEDKYSKAMNCTYVKDNKNINMQMGCYGIGVSRTLQAIIEQKSKENHIILPNIIAPYKVVIIPVSQKDETQQNVAINLYNKLLEKNVEVILDDRDLSLGHKITDFELMGIPNIIICGKKAKDNIVEFKTNKKEEKEEISIDNIYNILNI